ncbi:MAG: 2-C-methyl-D-erythritol 2,4-cyclodiphosphate synthase [Tidjanibacter sp.]|nr:2-C-methyl-D-erythritol 2,4-cyclodiphosphate synthase [Tidjanibacter sp.]
MTDLRVGQGYDVHALAEGKKLRLCGVDVPSDLGSVAHSDGDVAIHALCDALLGAAAAGDIGLHFPDTDAAYKGIDSMILLARTVEIVAAKGFEVVNIDLTIALQSPKLRPLIDTMRQRLSTALGISVENISVKATTTEHLGFEGRREGISATAVVLLQKRS